MKSDFDRRFEENFKFIKRMGIAIVVIITIFLILSLFFADRTIDKFIDSQKVKVSEKIGIE